MVSALLNWLGSWKSNIIVSVWYRYYGFIYKASNYFSLCIKEKNVSAYVFCLRFDGLLIFKTLLVGIFVSSAMRNLNVLSKGGNKRPPLDFFRFLDLPVLFLFATAGNVLNRFLFLLLLFRLKSFSSPRSSLFHDR